MRFLCVVAYLAPIVVHSLSIPQNFDLYKADPELFQQRGSVQSYTTFEVPCQADDEAFNFSFEVLKPIQENLCDASNLILNGQALQGTESTSLLFASVNGRSNITALSSLHDLNRTVEISYQTVCSLAANGSPFLATQDGPIGVTFVSIDAIEGRPSLSDANFYLTFDQRQQRILSALTSPEGATAVSTSSEGATAVSTSAGRATAVYTDPEGQIAVYYSSDDATATHQQSPPVPTPELVLDCQYSQEPIEDEAVKLQYLQNELDALTVAFNRQKAIVDAATTEESESTLEIKQCHDVGCVAHHIFRQVKNCVHFIIVKLTPDKPEPSSQPTIDPDCYWIHSHQSRVHAAMKGEKLCSTEPPSPESDKDPLSPSKHHTNNNRPPPSISSYSTTAQTDRFHRVLVPFTALASFLCLSCLTVRLHRTCCSPRARAERAARREERITRRQYAQLARRHRWRTWWNARLGRNNAPFSSDYEEKRALIHAQERVLHSAMEEEIQQIRRDALAYDEEAQCEESLPPYRSRAGSGTPPSYSSRGGCGASPTLVVGSMETVRAIGGVRDILPVEEITPDSSIAGLSRRNSSDTLHTLHTERSIV